MLLAFLHLLSALSGTPLFPPIFSPTSPSDHCCCSYYFFFDLESFRATPVPLHRAACRLGSVRGSKQWWVGSLFLHLLLAWQAALRGTGQEGTMCPSLGPPSLAEPNPSWSRAGGALELPLPPCQLKRAGRGWGGMGWEETCHWALKGRKGIFTFFRDFKNSSGLLLLQCGLKVGCDHAIVLRLNPSWYPTTAFLAAQCPLPLFFIKQLFVCGGLLIFMAQKTRVPFCIMRANIHLWILNIYSLLSYRWILDVLSLINGVRPHSESTLEKNSKFIYFLLTK